MECSNGLRKKESAAGTNQRRLHDLATVSSIHLGAALPEGAADAEPLGAAAALVVSVAVAVAVAVAEGLADAVALAFADAEAFALPAAAVSPPQAARARAAADTRTKERTNDMAISSLSRGRQPHARSLHSRG